MTHNPNGGQGSRKAKAARSGDQNAPRAESLRRRVPLRRSRPGGDRVHPTLSDCGGDDLAARRRRRWAPRHRQAQENRASAPGARRRPAPSNSPPLANRDRINIEGGQPCPRLSWTRMAAPSLQTAASATGCRIRLRTHQSTCLDACRRDSEWGGGAPMSVPFLLTPAQMRRIRPHFPLSHGVPRVDDRRVLSGIIFVIQGSLRWRDARRATVPTRPSTIATSAGAAWGCSAESSPPWPGRRASPTGRSSTAPT